MSRPDILLRMTEILRSREYTTAQYLADRLGISIRTVYRYINDLSLAGIPVLSQTGKGYWLDDSFDMPPVRLSPEELLALSLGSRLVQAIADPYLADAARQLVEKVEAVIPEAHQHLLNQAQMHAPVRVISDMVAERLGLVRRAIDQQQKLKIEYTDQQGLLSGRVIWPLAVAFWGQHWTIAAWCEQRSDYRAFRIDRIKQLCVKPQGFDTQEISLEGFVAKQGVLSSQQS